MGLRIGVGVALIHGEHQCECDVERKRYPAIYCLLDDFRRRSAASRRSGTLKASGQDGDSTRAAAPTFRSVKVEGARGGVARLMDGEPDRIGVLTSRERAAASWSRTSSRSGKYRLGDLVSQDRADLGRRAPAYSRSPSVPHGVRAVAGAPADRRSGWSAPANRAHGRNLPKEGQGVEAIRSQHRGARSGATAVDWLGKACSR